MGKVRKFEDLEIWRIARETSKFVECLFKTTRIRFNPRLMNQMEGSSGSIMDNIAEGFGRDGNREFHNFLSYAKGSSNELKSQAYRALDKGLITSEQFQKLSEFCNELMNRIGALMKYLRASQFKGQKFKNSP
ncbi:four helix bundle protein [Aureitalea sp. L0-47]|uniref:four helix bundle protein n=1 Tax=Aureitalea sp. L0-47 TaxID=2816962 RepID=UPI002238C6A9|nr:four helix bundle protein [Aureitalea sp. L0-47]MCW5519555.1 four helix bundle protein [Aureitalea sp. L0-47]